MTKCYTDYKLQCKDTNVISSYDYCVLDIEILAEGDEFPDQIAAKFPVNLVSIYSSIDGKIHTYVMDKENIYKDETIDVINSDNETISSFDVVYHYFTNEKELLSSVMSHVRKHDVVLAWNIIFDMPYIYNRMKNLGMDADSEFTKVKPFKPVFDMQYKSISIPGLIPIDALSLYKSLTYADGEKESYKLDYIASIELNSRKTSSGKHFYKLWEESRKDACYYNQIDVALTKLILDKYYAIDFNNQLRHLYGVNWNMVESISFGVESMLYYLMKSKGQIFIDKDKNGSVSGTYEGAFIHEPLKGIRFISTFDFSSLYPSIMITCNIDNDLLKGKILTVEDFSKYMMYRLYGKNGDEYISVYIVNENLDKIQTSIPISDFHEYVKDCVMTFNGCFFKKDTKSIVAELEEILLGRRKQYKKLYEENGSISDYVKQWAYKIAANSVYGYLGFEKSTLYDKDLAEAVTKTGQVLNKYCSLLYEYDFEKDDKEILDIIFTKYPTVNHQLDRKKVVYGDTDSIMITIDQDSNIDELVSKLESRFNERLKSLGIQIVNSNNPVWKLSYEKTGYILPVTKKRYALYQIHPKEKMIIKGLEVRKVNYPQLLREGYTNVLYMLLRDRKPINEIQEYIRQVDREFRNRYKNLDLATGVPVVWNSSKETYKVANPSIKGMLLFNSLVRKVFTPGSRGYLFDIKFNPLTPISRQAQIAYAKELGQLVGKVNTEKEIKQIQFIVLPYDLIEDDISKLNEMISKKIIIPMSDNTIKTYWYGKLADFGIQI
ncbi:MAG: DNA polymerase domain-containing protein [Nitrososphaerota archaeon]